MANPTFFPGFSCTGMLLDSPPAPLTAISQRPNRHHEQDCIREGRFAYWFCGRWLVDPLSILHASESFCSCYADEVLCYNYIYLLNPFSGIQVSLSPEPCFVTRQNFKLRFVTDVIASNCSPYSPKFFAVAFFLNRGVHWLAFCKIGDKSWTQQRHTAS